MTRANSHANLKAAKRSLEKGVPELPSFVPITYQLETDWLLRSAGHPRSNTVARTEPRAGGELTTHNRAAATNRPALCRCMNIPARYCTGYLGDIGVPPDPAPMDFSAWCEVFLGGVWYALDARHNQPRIGPSSAL